VGLVGTGGVHAIDEHLFALIDLAERAKVPRVAIHAFVDGRDTLPKSALEYLRATIEHARGRARIASVSGRYFAMDRDRRWDRTQKAYRVIVNGVGPTGTDALRVVEDAYNRGETDEFIPPTVIVDEYGRPVGAMHDGDAVICFNYRSDRMRQITRALIRENFDGFDVSDGPRILVTTMTQYDATFFVPVAFPPLFMARIVAEVLADQGSRCSARPRPRSTRT
jgi:2,3-bisphosphoglycerate-independent phosphoglycerate mutase